MKKSVFISILVVVFFAFSFSKINVACAQTIKCEVRKRSLAGEIFLFQYDDEGNIISWNGKSTVSEPMSEEEIKELEALINEITKGDV